MVKCGRCGDTWSGTAGYHVCSDTAVASFVKHDALKEVYALIPPGFEGAMAKVLTTGSIKYADKNWQLCKTPWRTYYSALRRHLAAAERGEGKDEETGQSHLANAACCLAFLWWFEQEGKLESR